MSRPPVPPEPVAARKTVAAPEGARGETRPRKRPPRGATRRKGQLPAWYRRFPPTREGWYFLTATLLIGLAALNAGLNPLFLVWGAMLSLIVMSGVLSELLHPPD